MHFFQSILYTIFILECSIKNGFSFDASEVGMKVVSGFHLRTDVQLWALAVSVAYNERKWLEKK